MIRVPKVPRYTPSADTEAGRRSMWLISFTDLISLMLAFFVLMFSMTEPQAQRWARLTQAVSARSTATKPSEAPPEPKAAFNAATLEPHSAVNLDYLGALLNSQIADTVDLAGVLVRREDDRVVIVLPGDALFEPRAGTFSDRGRRVLFLLGAVIGRIGNRIEVVGHAEREDVPAGLAWERSLGRAVAVSMALRETGYRRDLVARTAMAPLPRTGARDTRVDLVVREQGGQ
ncbi:MAG TPA: flagellar motor protein MotB [Azospirillum sp.]|nr:flagellar motor protein MotB [Azospirillum sp.]